MDGVITWLGDVRVHCMSMELPDDAEVCANAVNILCALLDGGVHTVEEANYNALSEQYRTLRQKYEAAGQAIHKNDVWHCPDCNSRGNPGHSFCHRCGKKLDWAQERGQR